MLNAMVEVYKLILIKKFKPRIVVHGHETMLVLTSPGGDYCTNYLLVDGKVKWLSGVNPFRILK